MAWRWDDYFRRRTALSSDSGLVDGFTVIGTVRGHGGDLAFSRSRQNPHLRCIVRVAIRQHVRCDLTRVGADSKMQLAPVPTCPAVPGGVPLALAARPRRLNVVWSGTSSASPWRQRLGFEAMTEA
jgi:hypothetical protein